MFPNLNFTHSLEYRTTTMNQNMVYTELFLLCVLDFVYKETWTNVCTCDCDSMTCPLLSLVTCSRNSKNTLAMAGFVVVSHILVKPLRACHTIVPTRTNLCWLGYFFSTT